MRNTSYFSKRKLTEKVLEDLKDRLISNEAVPVQQ